MFSRRPGIRFSRRSPGRAAFSSGPWQPYGYGSSLLLDWIVGDGQEFFDFGLGGVARIHDQSGNENHGVQLLTEVRQPWVDPDGVDGKPALFFDKTLLSSLFVDGLASTLSGTNKSFHVALYGAIPTGSTGTNGVFFSAGHASGTGSLQLHWPRATGTANGRVQARRIGDAGTDSNRLATPNATTARRLLHIGTTGTVLTGEHGDTPTTTPLAWDSTAFGSGACTLDRVTVGCDRNAAAPDGATGCSFWLRRLTVWSTPPPAANIADWNTMVIL